MKHCREDYNRIQDPALEHLELLKEGSTPIGADEPVFLLRAQDKAAPGAVEAWAIHHRAAGGDPQLSFDAMNWAQRMKEWQEAHGAKNADL